MWCSRPETALANWPGFRTSVNAVQIRARTCNPLLAEGGHSFAHWNQVPRFRGDCAGGGLAAQMLALRCFAWREIADRRRLQMISTTLMRSVLVLAVGLCACDKPPAPVAGPPPVTVAEPVSKLSLIHI